MAHAPAGLQAGAVGYPPEDAFRAQLLGFQKRIGRFLTALQSLLGLAIQLR
jgi:hypothetical protein